MPRWQCLPQSTHAGHLVVPPPRSTTRPAHHATPVDHDKPPAEAVPPPASPVASLGDLPDELLSAIAAAATAPTLVALAATSRRLRRAALQAIVLVAAVPEGVYLNPSPLLTARLAQGEVDPARAAADRAGGAPRSPATGAFLASFLWSTPPRLRALSLVGWLGAERMD